MLLNSLSGFTFQRIPTLVHPDRYDFLIFDWPGHRHVLLSLGLYWAQDQRCRFLRNRHDESVADDATDVVFSCVWLGVAVLGAMLTTSALFGAVSIYTAIICLVLPCIILLIRPFRKELWNLLDGAWLKLYIGPTAFIVPVVMLALVSFLGSQPIIYFDTAYYHLPLAQIFETFGALKGLVALHPNFGQTSTWFAIAAPGTVGGELGWGVPTANTALAGIAALHASVGFLKCTKVNSDRVVLL